MIMQHSTHITCSSGCKKFKGLRKNSSRFFSMPTRFKGVIIFVGSRHHVPSKFLCSQPRVPLAHTHYAPNNTTTSLRLAPTLIPPLPTRSPQDLPRPILTFTASLIYPLSPPPRVYNTSSSSSLWNRELWGASETSKKLKIRERTKYLSWV